MSKLKLKRKTEVCSNEEETDRTLEESFNEFMSKSSSSQNCMTDCKYVIVHIINLQAYTYKGKRGRSERGQAIMAEASMVKASGVSRVEAQGCIEQG
jgi:hypothetical protein